MAKNINQITNIVSTVLDTDKFYLGRSPYGITDDAVILGSNLRSNLAPVQSVNGVVGAVITSAYTQGQVNQDFVFSSGPFYIYNLQNVAGGNLNVTLAPFPAYVGSQTLILANTTGAIGNLIYKYTGSTDIVVTPNSIVEAEVVPASAGTVTIRPKSILNYSDFAIKSIQAQPIYFNRGIYPSIITASTTLTDWPRLIVVNFASSGSNTLTMPTYDSNKAQNFTVINTSASISGYVNTSAGLTAQIPPKSVADAYYDRATNSSSANVYATIGKKQGYLGAFAFNAISGTGAYAYYSTTTNNIYPYIGFVATSSVTSLANAYLQLPTSWDKATVFLILSFKIPSTTTSQVAVFTVSLNVRNPGDTGAISPTSTTTINVSPVANSEALIQTTEVTLALNPSAISPATNSELEIRISRAGNGGSDTLTTEARLVGAKFGYMSNFGNDA